MGDVLSEALQKAGPVLIVCENNGFIDAPHHYDVVQGAGNVQAGLAAAWNKSAETEQVCQAL